MLQRVYVRPAARLVSAVRQRVARQSAPYQDCPNRGLAIKRRAVGHLFPSALPGAAVSTADIYKSESGDLDVAPAFERCFVALVLVIAGGRASPLHRDRQARLGKELLGGLVQAHQRVIGIAWPRVDCQHIFHGGYERAIGFRRDDPALLAMGLENVFLVPAQSSSRWRDRQFAVPRPFSQACVFRGIVSTDFSAS